MLLMWGSWKGVVRGFVASRFLVLGHVCLVLTSVSNDSFVALRSCQGQHYPDSIFMLRSSTQLYLFRQHKLFFHLNLIGDFPQSSSW